MFVLTLTQYLHLHKPQHTGITILQTPLNQCPVSLSVPSFNHLKISNKKTFIGMPFSIFLIFFLKKKGKEKLVFYPHIRHGLKKLRVLSSAAVFFK